MIIVKETSYADLIELVVNFCYSKGIPERSLEIYTRGSGCPQLLEGGIIALRNSVHKLTFPIAVVLYSALPQVNILEQVPKELDVLTHEDYMDLFAE